jgi:hypothetical protein
VCHENIGNQKNSSGFPIVPGALSVPQPIAMEGDDLKYREQVDCCKDLDKGICSNVRLIL